MGEAAAEAVAAGEREEDCSCSLCFGENAVGSSDSCSVPLRAVGTVVSGNVVLDLAVAGAVCSGMTVVGDCSLEDSERRVVLPGWSISAGLVVVEVSMMETCFAAVAVAAVVAEMKSIEQPEAV